MLSIVQEITFAAGHRLREHEGKCRNLHGHNYRAQFHLSAPETDSLGRVIDFGEIKSRLGTWVKNNWDHAFLLAKSDEEGRRAMECIPDQRLFLLDKSPTVETMASYLLDVVGPEALRGSRAYVTKVVLWETDDQFCIAERDEELHGKHV